MVHSYGVLLEAGLNTDSSKIKARRLELEVNIVNVINETWGKCEFKTRYR